MLPPTPPTSANQTPLGAHRGKPPKNHGSKRSHQQRDKHRPGHDKRGHGKHGHEKQGQENHGHEKQGKSGSRNGRQERRPTQDDVHVKTEPTQRDVQTKTEENEAPTVKEEDEGDGEWNFESEEDLKHIFPETKVKLADPVGIPLPADYTDEPTIPPAYNATCIKSEFFLKDNSQEFVQSIRELACWDALKHDPVFMHYPGMVLRQFPGSEHKYPTYDRSEAPSPSAPIKLPPRYEIDRSALEATPSNNMAVQSMIDLNGHGRHYLPPGNRLQDPVWDRGDRNEDNNRHPSKRSIDATSENDRDDNFKRPRWSQPQRDRSPDKYNRGPGSNYTRRPALDKLQDSGYYSGQSQEKAPNDQNSKDRRPSYPSYQRYRSRSPSRGRSATRTGSRGRSRTPTPAKSNRSRSESPLTWMEMRLLGMAAGKSSEEEEEPEPAKPKVTKKPIRRVKVAAAFK